MSAKNLTFAMRIAKARANGIEPTNIIAERDQSYINDIAKLSREFAQDIRDKRYDKASATLRVLCESARKKIIGLSHDLS